MGGGHGLQRNQPFSLPSGIIHGNLMALVRHKQA